MVYGFRGCCKSSTVRALNDLYMKGLPEVHKGVRGFLGTSV